MTYVYTLKANFHKLPLGLADYILTTLHVNVLPYTDGLGFSVLLNCFQHIFGSCPDVLQSSSNLGELLEEWAAKAEEERLGRDHSSNQALAIQIILHPIILDASVATGPSLVKVGLQVIQWLYLYNFH